MNEQSMGAPPFEERFRIITTLGSGCYGDVFKAYDSYLNKVVAMKRIRKLENIDVNGAPMSFYREINVLNNEYLQRDNVITLFDTVHNSSGELFLVMEYCEYDLQVLIDHKLSPAQTLNYFYQICSGLLSLHDMEIAHRDLKPANILVNANNELKITDFGLSKSIQNSKNTPRVGSGCYRAPEILAGDGSYDQSIDVWSIGCILFEMITRKRFIQGGTDIQELQELASIYGPSELAQNPLFTLFLQNNTFSNNSLSNYLNNQIPSSQSWAIPYLLGMLQLNPQKRPSLKELHCSISYLQSTSGIQLPKLDIAERPFKATSSMKSSPKYGISPPRISPPMVFIEN